MLNMGAINISIIISHIIDKNFFILHFFKPHVPIKALNKKTTSQERLQNKKSEQDVSLLLYWLIKKSFYNIL